MKILIGHDGSDHANAALRDLRRAGLPFEATAVAISIPAALVAQRDQDNTPFHYSVEEVEQAAAMAKQASGLVREYFPSWEVRAEVAIGSVVRNMAKKISQWNPDLIVLGLQTGLSTSRNYFGSIPQRIAAQASCSVRVTHSLLAEPDDTPRVLLCVDDSRYAATAVNAVAARNWPKGTEIRILTVIDPYDYSIPELLDSALERARARHRLIANELERTPAFTSSLVKEGEPAKVILKIAEEWKPDAIFLAPRNKSRLRRWLRGGVSGTVVARAQCPVELVRTQKASSALTFQDATAASAAYD